MSVDKKDKSKASKLIGKMQLENLFHKSAGNDSLIGQTLFGHYQILDLLGEGGSSIVYVAKHSLLERIVAMKTLKGDGASNPAMVARFTREVRAHARLRHKNIVEAIDCLALPSGQTFFIMEYLEGISLQNLIDTQGRVEREEEFYTIITQVCDALQHAHQNKIIHRDMKPGNVVLLNIDDQIVAKVVDFGLASISDDSQQRLTQAGQTLGSPLYMSPEQCMGKPLSSRSDIYSLGIVAFETITGFMPYAGETIMEVMEAHCSTDRFPAPLTNYRNDLKGVELLQMVISKALAKTVEHRYQTVSEFRTDLDKWWHAIKPKDQRPVEMPVNPSIQFLDVPVEEQQKSIVALVAYTQTQVQQKNRTLLLSADSIAAAQPRQRSAKVMFLWLATFAGTAMVLSVVLGIVLINNAGNIGDTWINASQAVSNTLHWNASPDSNNAPATPKQTQKEPIPKTVQKAIPRPNYYQETIKYGGEANSRRLK